MAGFAGSLAHYPQDLPLSTSLSSQSFEISQRAPAGDWVHAASEVDFLRPARHVHLIGIAGQGMRSLTRILHAAGWCVTGSDNSQDGLDGLLAQGFKVSRGHSADHLPADVDEVIYTGAVSDDNPELVAARKRNLPTLSYAEAIGRLTAGRDVVAVAGTHGKSTTTAMTAEILLQTGIDPTVICGAEPVTDGQQAFRYGGRFGRGRVAVVEACEYRRHFLNLRPRWAVITGIEQDHFDSYRGVDDLRQAFGQFAQQVDPAGRLLVAEGDTSSDGQGPAAMSHGKSLRELLAGASTAPIETFGTSDEADWQASQLREHRGRFQFLLRYAGVSLGRVSLTVPGLHNVQNALAAAAACHHAGAEFHDIVGGLEAFLGLRRRLEWMGQCREIDLWTDYAHHPTEVTATLSTLRQIYPDRRICVVFQPHQESRTRHLLDPLAESLKDADIVAITTIFRAREPENVPGSVTAADLADRVGRGGRDDRVQEPGPKVLPDHDLSRIKQRLHETCRPGDVLVTMGAGDIAARCHEYADWI